MTVTDILHEALALHQAGRLRDAVEGYRRALERSPDDPNALNFAGVAYAGLGENARALELLTRCVSVAPDHAQAHANLGLALRAVGRLEEALAAQEQVLRLTPEQPEALNELGITLRRMGRFHRAVEAFTAAVQAAPGFGDAHANRGNALQDLDRMEEAAASYREAIRHGADRAGVHRGLGNALQRLHRLDDAIAAYRTALERDPDYVPALTDLGGVLVETGNAERGVESLRRAATLAPEDAMVHSNLAMALDEMGQHRGALDAFDRALALEPGNTHALAFQSITLHRLGEHTRWHRLTGLDTLVREMVPPVPAGYPSLAALNEDLAEYARSHPSVFHGRRRGISSELFLDGEGSPAALRDSIRAAVCRYIDELPAQPGHPFVDRRPAAFLLSGWCNVLDTGADAHIHPNAWLSGVYYVRTEGVVGDGGEDMGGCLEVGAPDQKHYRVEDYPVRVFRPREGYMVVFPSYVWHRILPFEGRGQRISYAFDVVPTA